MAGLNLFRKRQRFCVSASSAYQYHWKEGGLGICIFILQPAITEEQLTIMMRSLCPKHPADQDGKDASRSWDMRDRAGACLCSHIGAGDGRATSISADAGRNPTASRWRPAIAIASKFGDQKLSEYGTTTGNLPVWRTCYGGPKPTWLMEEMPEMRVEVGFRAEESRAPERGKDLLIGKTLEDHVPMGDDRRGDKEADGMFRQSTVVDEASDCTGRYGDH